MQQEASNRGPEESSSREGTPREDAREGMRLPCSKDVITTDTTAASKMGTRRMERLKRRQGRTKKISH